MIANLNMICGKNAANAHFANVMSGLTSKYCKKIISCEIGTYWKNDGLIQAELQFDPTQSSIDEWERVFVDLFQECKITQDIEFVEFSCFKSQEELIRNSSSIFAVLTIPFSLIKETKEIQLMIPRPAANTDDTR